MAQSMDEIKEMLTRPKGGDRIYLTPDNYEKVVPALYPWWVSGDGYGESQTSWVRDMLRNPIRHSNLRAVYDDYAAGGVVRGWIISWSWASPYLTEAQKAVLRKLPEMSAAWAKGDTFTVMPPTTPLKDWEVTLLRGDVALVHMLCEIKNKPGMHIYCQAEGTLYPKLGDGWTRVSCDSCIEKGKEMGYI